MKTPAWWQHRGIIAWLLWPLSQCWRLAAALRQWMARPEKLAIPVWCVGNVAAGGGGKTPCCLLLGGQLKAAGINAYFIARGYGGSQKAALLVNPSQHDAARVGDEALLLAKCLPTVVATKRLEAAKAAVELGAELLVMDDGLQYPHLHKDLTFLMLKGSAPLGNGLLIPSGPLRQPLATALQQSDILISIDGAQGAPHGFSAHNKPHWQMRSALKLPANMPVNMPRRVIGFAGIAHPQDFHKALLADGLEVVAFHAFADHHAYSHAEIETMLAEAALHEVALITTAKDHVRLHAEHQEKITVAHQHVTLDAMADLQDLISDRLKKR